MSGISHQNSEHKTSTSFFFDSQFHHGSKRVPVGRSLTFSSLRLLEVVFGITSCHFYLVWSVRTTRSPTTFKLEKRGWVLLSNLTFSHSHYSNTPIGTWVRLNNFLLHKHVCSHENDYVTDDRTFKDLRTIALKSGVVTSRVNETS